MAAAQYFSELFDTELAAAHQETTRELASAQKVAHVLHFICSSCYIPGKQEWRGVLKATGFSHQGLLAKVSTAGGFRSYGQTPRRCDRPL